MDEIVNKFFLDGDKFMPEMHLKQPGFSHSTCGPFTKNKERIGNTVLFIKMNLISLVFNIIWLMAKQKI